MINKKYRQGDVSLHEVTRLPDGLREVKDKILAYGEVTGHRHWLKGKSKVFEDSTGLKYVQVLQDTELVHSGEDLQPVYEQEIAEKQDKHLVIILLPGFYKVGQEREFDPFQDEIRKVLD